MARKPDGRRDRSGATRPSRRTCRCCVTRERPLRQIRGQSSSAPPAPTLCHLGTVDATAGTTAAVLADQPGWVSSAVSSPATLPQSSRQPARHQSGLPRQFRGRGCVQLLVRRNRSTSAPEMNSAESNSDEETNQANNLKAIAQTLESATPEEDSRDRQQKHANASNQH